MIFPFGDFFCRSGLAGNPPADTFKTAASTSALTLASGAPWVQSSTVSASGQRVWSMRRLRSSRSACGTARVKGVVAPFIRRILCSIGWGRVESDMASPLLLSVTQSYQFDQKSIRRSVRIASILLGNRSVVRFGEQLSQKVNKHGDFAGLTAGRGSHGADRNSGRLTIAQDSPHGSGAYVGREKPVRRLGDTEARKDRGALFFAIIAAKRCRRLIGYDPGAASEGPGARSVL